MLRLSFYVVGIVSTVKRLMHHVLTILPSDTADSPPPSVAPVLTVNITTSSVFHTLKIVGSFINEIFILAVLYSAGNLNHLKAEAKPSISDWEVGVGLRRVDVAPLQYESSRTSLFAPNFLKLTLKYVHCAFGGLKITFSVPVVS